MTESLHTIDKSLAHVCYGVANVSAHLLDTVYNAVWGFCDCFSKITEEAELVFGS